MSLVGEWRRRVVGAAGVGLAVPLAVGAAAVAVGLGGGLTGLGALGQAVTGPVIPDSRTAADTQAGRDGRPDTDLLAQARMRAEARRAAADAQSRSERPQRRARAADHDSAPLADERSRTDSSAPSTGSAPVPAQPTTGSTTTQTGLSGVSTATEPPQIPPPPSSHPAPAPPGARDGVNQVAPAVRGLPLLGATGAQIVGQLVTAVDGLLTPR